MTGNGNGSGSDATFRRAVFSIAAIASCAYAGWLGNSVLNVGEKLVRIETTIDENRQERQGQIADIRARLQRLEGDVYYSDRRQPSPSTQR